MTQVDVLIITALQIEFEAARAAGLATVPGGPGVGSWTERDAGGAEPYLLGEYVGPAGRRLTVALARSIGIGGRSTSPFATSLTGRLHPTCLAMCGVCAGDPAVVALGDVVVAELAYEYDEGQLIGADFIGDHRQIPLDHRWVRAAQDLSPANLPTYGQASEEEGRIWFLARLLCGQEPRDHPARNRYFPKGTWHASVAALESDGLIRQLGRRSALTADGRTFIQRVMYGDVEGPARLPYAVTVGPVASGSFVVQDGVTWDRLRRMGVRPTAIEMEAATIATVARQELVPHWLVVKGVMDHADPRKDDRYRSFAARASAEVLYALLLRLVDSGVEVPAPHRPAPPQPAPPRYVDRTLTGLFRKWRRGGAFSPGRTDPRRLRDAADALADDVAGQLTRRLADRELSLGRLLDVAWTAGPAQLVDPDASLGRRIGVPADLADRARPRLDGSIGTVVTDFRRLKVRRVVLTGPPGAGKTTLALTLTAGLLADRRPDEPVPLLLPLSTWPVDVADFYTWIADHLRKDHPFLAAPGVGAAATELPFLRRIVPILDGLDEMSPAARDAAIRALNRLPDDEPFVLICRRAEYEDIVGRVGFLRETPVVELRAIGVDRALRLLDPKERWHAVRARIATEGAGGPLATALGTPLMIDIARRVYGGGVRDHAVLADRDALPDVAAIERHLLEMFLAVAFQAYPVNPLTGSRVHGWPATRTRAWLGFLARHSSRPGGAGDLTGTGDIAWWQIRRAAGGFRHVAAVLFAVACGLAFGLGADVLRVPTGSVPVGLVAAAGFGALFWLLGEAGPGGPGGRKPWVATAASLAGAGLLGGIAAALPAGVSAGIIGGTGTGAAFGAIIGIACALRVRRPVDTAGGWRHDLWGGLVVGAVSWVVAGLVIGFPYGQPVGAVDALPAGFAVDSLQAARHGLAYGSAHQLGLGLAVAVLVGLVCGGTAAAVTGFCRAFTAWTARTRRPGWARRVDPIAAVAAGGCGAAIGAVTMGTVFGPAGASGGCVVGLAFGVAYAATRSLATRIPETGPSPLRARWEMLRANGRALLRAGLVSGLAGGLATGLVYGGAPDSFGPVGGPVTDQVALAAATAVVGALTFAIGVALVFAPLAQWAHRPSRLTARAAGRLRALAVHLAGGTAFGGLAAAVYELTFDTRGTPRTVAAGVVFGVALGLAIWLRVPVDDAPAADPRSTLRQDRSATLITAILLGVGAGIAVLVADGPPLALMAGTIVLGTVLCSSSWLRFVVARTWLTCFRRVPPRLLAFCDDASRVGLLRQVGPVYQFRHARLREQLEGPPPAGPAEPVAAVPRGARARRPVRVVAGALATLVGLALLGPVRHLASADGWLGARALLAAATAAEPVRTGYGGCEIGAPSYLRDGRTVRLRDRADKPPFWWCPAWQGPDVTALRTTVVVHSGVAALVYLATADRRSGYAIELRAGGYYRMVPSSAELGEHRSGWFGGLDVGPNRMTRVDLVDRDGALHLYIDGRHVNSARHRGYRRVVVGVGVVRAAGPADATFTDVTVWGLPPG
jgi:nucleoside phosphorylase